MSPSDQSSVPWKFTKGMSLSYVALVSALVKSKTLTMENVIQELDLFIRAFTEHHSDSIEIIETMKMVKDAVLAHNPKPDDTDENTLWFSDFIGNA